MEKDLKLEKFTEYREASITLRTLSKAHCLMVFRHIQDNVDTSVEEITAHLQKTIDPMWSQPETSTVLAELRKSKLVSFRREGKYIHYRDNVEVSAKVFSLADKLVQIYKK